MNWLHDLFGSCASAPAERKADDAINNAEEVIHKSRSLRAQLEPYRNSPDPFFEVFRKTHRAKVFEAKAELETPRARPE